ncbi:hypothetical protein HYH03_003383 [Edaphochlamys debaryana]|uniref:Uncharacterized protein n=1 Tax=Edaphochlamys debaryana TaxID=47281 RepID=A0A835YD40_9CHLO|nr:hypothetical protein HYH03_003383 [Edaphochlamys debaryana]|eukprot:KAG2498636.1 hypothetical protein HYH03_003383 [Edaphochlamys debaryana]
MEVADVDGASGGGGLNGARQDATTASDLPCGARGYVIPVVMLVLGGNMFALFEGYCRLQQGAGVRRWMEQEELGTCA